MDENSFIEQLNRKQTGAYRILLRTYSRTLVLYALGFQVEQDVAEDAVQEVFINLYEGEMSFPSATALRSFLYTSVRNRVLNHLKHEKIKQGYLQQIEWKGATEEDEEVELKILKEEVYRRIFVILETLPSQCRRIFEMHLEGRKNEDIASLLQLSVHTVKTQKKRAMQQLRRQLGNLYEVCLLLWPL